MPKSGEAYKSGESKTRWIELARWTGLETEPGCQLINWLAEREQNNVGQARRCMNCYRRVCVIKGRALLTAAIATWTGRSGLQDQASR